jgi:hypothetical protein
MATSQAAPKLTPTMMYMKVMASQKVPAPGPKAQQSIVDKLRTAVNLLASSPDGDYGQDKVTEDNLEHRHTVAAAVMKIADLLTEAGNGDTKSATAVAATGFTQYFAEYFCGAMGMKSTPLANKCNEEVGGNLLAMLNKVKI